MITALNMVLIEDCSEDTCIIRKQLRSVMQYPFQMFHFRQTPQARPYIRTNREDLDMIFFDVTPFPIAEAEDILKDMAVDAPTVPVIAIGPNNHDYALSMISSGAEDYLSLDKIENNALLLRDAVDFALKRHRLLIDAREKAAIKLEEKERIIAWLSGSYSVEKGGYEY